MLKRDWKAIWTAFTRSAAAIPAAGAVLGVAMAAPDLAAQVVNGLRARRVLIGAAGPRANVLKIRPPLPFTEAHADRFLAAMAEVLHGLR